MVTTPVHLGIAGTHGTATTTLARRIEMELRAGGLTVARVSGLATRAAALGFAKMTRHTPASTEWIITSGAAASSPTPAPWTGSRPWLTSTPAARRSSWRPS
ncbi:hypothetical protein HS041_27955 [Planomonospora sp. ID67723]|uniref:hypothetical protein n=1 Tax=Planomonospora sp. ID67723 TaxID=2738134 RepID=UPI0018C44799|nr:hypothetical protein [Planomonospora sp. ID67723]MBG0831573.1 hypothetical protein [Planomonospora sp. ID67723]